MEEAEEEDDMTKIEFETSEGVEVIPTFDGIGLREDLLRGIYAYGLYNRLFDTRTREIGRNVGKICEVVALFVLSHFVLPLLRF